jgi:hypothetical protein
MRWTIADSGRPRRGCTAVVTRFIGFEFQHSRRPERFESRGRDRRGRVRGNFPRGGAIGCVLIGVTAILGGLTRPLG